VIHAAEGASMSTSATEPVESAPPRIRLRFYIAGTTPNSVRAVNNLSITMAEFRNVIDQVDLEIIDVFKYPKQAIKDSILVTPTLLWVEKNTQTRIIGDLSDNSQLKLLLRRLAV
jgi:hypothetical protein